MEQDQELLGAILKAIVNHPEEVMVSRHLDELGGHSANKGPRESEADRRKDTARNTYDRASGVRKDVSCESDSDRGGRAVPVDVGKRICGDIRRSRRVKGQAPL